MRTLSDCVTEAVALANELRQLRLRAKTLPIDATERWSLSIRAGELTAAIRKLSEEYDSIREMNHEDRAVS